MLIQAPIFLNCFSRGGSNVFWNLFLTHPDVCSPIIETLEIFRLSWPKPRWEGFMAALLSRQPRLFDQWHLEPRHPLPASAQQYIDRTLYAWKLKTIDDIDMQFKREGERYTREEVEQARLVAKNNNGLAFMTDVWLDMYPDATFFGLVRHPLPLYESHKRRKIASSVEDFAETYRRLAEQMLADAERLKQYHVVRFEDLLKEPIGFMEQVYAQAGLDREKVSTIRFKAKPHYQDDGERTTEYQEGRHYWFETDEVYKMLEPQINSFHVAQLEAQERRAVLERTASVRERLGYQQEFAA